MYTIMQYYLIYYCKYLECVLFNISNAFYASLLNMLMYSFVLNIFHYIECIILNIICNKFLRFHSIYAIILNAFSSTECILFYQIRNTVASFLMNVLILYIF